MVDIFVDGKMYKIEDLSIDELKELNIQLKEKEEYIRNKIEKLLY